jgi:hypothetical protein
MLTPDLGWRDVLFWLAAVVLICGGVAFGNLTGSVAKPPDGPPRACEPEGGR